MPVVALEPLAPTMFSTFSRCANSSSATAVEEATQPLIMIALFWVMKRVCACTATFGLVSVSATA